MENDAAESDGHMIQKMVSVERLPDIAIVQEEYSPTIDIVALESIASCEMCAIKEDEIAQLREKAVKSDGRLNDLRKKVKASKDHIQSQLEVQQKSFDEKLAQMGKNLKDVQNAFEANQKTNDAKFVKFEKLVMAGRSVYLRILITAARDIITKKLGRRPDVHKDGTVLWKQFLTGLTPDDHTAIDMTAKLVKFILKQLLFCNTIVHRADKGMVAKAIVTLDSPNVSTWRELFGKVYYGETPEGVLRAPFPLVL